MRAVGVYRSPKTGVASTGSEPGFSTSRGPVGVEAIRDYCDQFHHHLVNTFTDADGDNNYAGLITSVAGPSGNPALIIIPDSTHLADDLETLVERLLELQSTGSEIRCLDPDYPDVVQNGLRLLSLPGRSPTSLRRIRDAILAKASRGEVLGRTPYGYWAGLDGQLKVDDAEAAVVRHIFDEYAGPPPVGGLAPVGGQGLRKIAAGLNERGLTTRKGRPWTPVAIAGVLRNRAYVGTYTRYGVRISGSHQPLIDRTKFNQVQQVLESRKPSRRASSAEPYLLGGLARCALCGQGVFGLTRKRSWNRKNGEKVDRIYRYYECPGRYGAGKRDGRRSCVVEGFRTRGHRPGQIAGTGQVRPPAARRDRRRRFGRLSPARGKRGRVGTRIHEGVEVCSFGLRQCRQPDQSARKSPAGAGGRRKRKR